MQSWLRETHGRQFELARHFLSQQLTNELISSDQTRRLAISVVAVLACVGPLVVRLYVPKYGYLQGLPTPDLYLAAVRADRLFFVTLSMIAAGLVTAMQWQSLFPDLQDYLALKPLPVKLYQIFVARFLSCFILLLVVLISLDLPASLLFPFLASGKWQSPGFGVRYVVAHAAATCGAGLFIFLALTAVQGILLNLLPVRLLERLSVLMQTLFALLFVVAVPYAIDMPNWHQALAARPHWTIWFPPAWFLGLYEQLLGSRDLYFVKLATIAMEAIGIAAVATLASYLVSYRRHITLLLQQKSPSRQAETRTAAYRGRLMEKLMASSHQRAAFDFGLQILRRSRPHKLLMTFWIGIALVMALETAIPVMVTHIRSGEAWAIWQLQSVLAIPLVLSGILVCALGYVFQIPAELRANWIFRMAESSGRESLLGGVERLLIVCGLAPVMLLTLPIEALALGWTLALAHALLATALILLLIEVRLHEWHKLPFTCSHAPGRKNLWQIGGLYLLLFAIVIPTITYFEARLLKPVFVLTVAAGLSLLYLHLRSVRRAHWVLVPLVFDEADEPAISTIGLSPE